MARRLHRTAGVSLIEALVAMSVMGVGTLAVLGVQTTLRFNSDLSKQRGEAVRIAQEQIEQVRAFGDLAAYNDDIVDEVSTETAVNAEYTITRSVVEGTDLDDARLKQLRVEVSWEDRTGQVQAIRLETAIHGTPPALAGSLLIPAQVGPTSTPGGRHRAIPPGAVLIPGTSNSSFAPPGSPDGVSWTFNNVTGAITSLCTSSSPESCTATDRRLVSGTVRFATAAEPAPPASPPTGYYFDAGETPQGPDSTEANLVQGVAVRVALTSPTTGTASCFSASDLVSSARLYHCAVPVNTEGAWSGRIEVTGSDVSTPPWVLATNIADTTAGRYRVCRYTPVTGCQPAVAAMIWGQPGATATCAAPEPQTTPPTPSRRLRNDDFPRNHASVTGALLNQNFLVRQAANGCPADGPAPQINTNTWHHQPAT